MLSEKDYSADYFSYERLITRKVKIGTLIFGDRNPIVVQSMCNTNTTDTKATVEQCVRIIKAGGELVRIAVQGVAEAENLKSIKAELIANGYDTPLAADVHFNPKVAEIAAQHVEKVRINPGNYAEKNTKAEYSENEYQLALQKTAEKLNPLISVCKKHKTVIRIGVNHGSLSNRIMSRYGNTAEGMVESALEFVKIFEESDFYDLIISLKSSHVLTMVHANRMLAARMQENKIIYPIHLGVTEAGNGIEGRQKSIAGIATLLNDGIGDTIRVSLTEAPENEIPIAINLRESCMQEVPDVKFESKKPWFNPFSFHKRISESVQNIGGKNLPVIIMTAAQRNSCKVQKPIQGNDSPPADIFYIGREKPIFLFSDKKYIQDFAVWENEHPNCYPLVNGKEFIRSKFTFNQIIFVQLSLDDFISTKCLSILKNHSSAILVLTAKTEHPIAEWRKAFYLLHNAQIKNPVLLHREFNFDQNEALLLESTKAYSALLLDGFGDGIWLEDKGNIHIETIKSLSFGILQSCRVRLTQTDYIACPSCGRTLFNIEERLEEIRKKTKHLKHLKIAVMGCIVNGLGEMADADYGYVGSGNGKVNLYKGNTLMRKSITEKEASDVLVALIKSEGDWIDN